jgi:hypothetical protein
VLVQKALAIGDSFVAGVNSGKVKAMYGERNHRVKKQARRACSGSQVYGMPQAAMLWYCFSDRDGRRFLSSASR